MKFSLPDPLPRQAAELRRLSAQVEAEINVFRARQAARHEFGVADLDRAKYLVAGRKAIMAAERFDWAVHEAGHAVLATLVGGRVKTAEITAGGPRPTADGMLQHGSCDCEFDLVTEPSRPLVAAAGILAQAVHQHGPRPTSGQILALTVGTGDEKELRRLALTAGSPPMPTQEVLPLVIRCWQPIVKLANQIHQRGPVTHEDVAKALGLSQDPGLHAFEIANIRAGI